MEGLNGKVYFGRNMVEAEKVVTRRFSIPRDMGRRAGSSLRGVLMRVAEVFSRRDVVLMFERRIIRI